MTDPAEPETTLVGPGDPLNGVQTLRIMQADAILGAKIDAVRSGQLTKEQLSLYDWSVVIHPAGNPDDAAKLTAAHAARGGAQ